MRDQVAVAHPQLGLQILKRPARPSGQQRHDRQSSFFVDRFVELVKIEHRSFDGNWFARPHAFPRPRGDGVDEMVETKGGAHRQVGNIPGKISFDCPLHHRNSYTSEKESPSQENERARRK